MSTAAIIVAAGSGQRFGNAGKSFALLLGKPMAWWSLQAAAAAASIDEIVLVCGAHSFDAAAELVGGLAPTKPVTLTIGGARRQDSARTGIDAASAHTTLVAIHDAARPLVTSALFDDVVAAAAEHGAAIAAIPVSDTIKRVANECVVETLLRNELVSVQTPQAFRKQLLLDAFTCAEHSAVTVTDEASLIEHLGGEVRVVRGSTTNMKVTFTDDLIVAEALLQRDRR